MAMQRTRLEGQTVLTADLCKELHDGDCSQCNGIASTDDFGPSPVAEPVFCTHECHLKKETVH